MATMTLDPPLAYMQILKCAGTAVRMSYLIARLADNWTTFRDDFRRNASSKKSSPNEDPVETIRKIYSWSLGS